MSKIPPVTHDYNADENAHALCVCGFPLRHHFHNGVTSCPCDDCKPLIPLEVRRPRVGSWFRRRFLS